MEFNPDVLKLHGAILSLGNRGLLNNSDSEETISVLKDVFQHASYLAKSQMTFLMILNSDLSVLTQLENDENVCLFTRILPLIEKDVLVKFMFDLSLQSHVYDVIKNCHSAFTNEIISVVLKNFRNSDFLEKEYGISHLYQFWTAVFVKIHNINQGLQEDTGSGVLVHYFEELYDHIESTLLVSFKSEKNDISLYVGTHLYYFFNQILFFLLMVNNRNYKFEPDEFYDFKFNIENVIESDVEKPSFVSIFKVFNNLHKIMDCFTVEFWKNLNNLFLDFDSKCSLQELIGHAIYRICEELNNLSPQVSSHIPTTGLQYLSKYRIKPKSEIEMLSEESIFVIMKNVGEGKEKEKWFKALLPHYNSNYTLVMDCITRNLNLADKDDITFLLEDTLSLLKKEENEINVGRLKEFSYQVFKSTRSDMEHALWFKKTLDLPLGLLKTEAFDRQLTEIFNKLDRYFCNKQQSDVQKELVWCCMQAPEETLLKICQIALHSRNSEQVSLCCGILRDLEYVCNVNSPESEGLRFFEEIALKIIRSDQYGQSEEDCVFVSFLTELCKENFFGFEFFEKILELIISYFKKKDLHKVRFLLEIVESCKPYKLFSFNKSAFLVFVCQILPPLSWNLETFCSPKPKILCRRIIDDVIRELTNEDDGVELEWARQEILKYEEIHQSYFCDLWFKFNRRWSGSGSFMSTLLALLFASGDVESILTIQKENLNLKKPSSGIKDFLISNFEVLLPQLCDEYQWRRLDQILRILLSPKYWNVNNEISENINVLEVFSSSMYLLALQLNENSKIYNCFQFCVVNFGSLRFFDRMPQHDFDEVLDLVEKMTFSVQAVENDKYREIFSYFIMTVIFKFIDEVCKDKMPLYETKIKKMARVLNVRSFEEIVNRISTKML